MSDPVARPSPVEERCGRWLLFALAPGLGDVGRQEPPPALGPAEPFDLACRDGGTLSATWFPAGDDAAAGEPSRGVVLMLHPWLPWGQAYFFRRGRIPAARGAGLDVLTVDLPGFGASARAKGFMDRAVEDALAEAHRRAGDRPVYLWGVSSGGYWAHIALGRADGESRVEAAMFEDVSPHLLEWSANTAPRGKPFYRLYPKLFPRAYRYLDVRRHAPHLRAARVAYAGGGRDRGIPSSDLRDLAARARGRVLVVEDAKHLHAIKQAGDAVIRLALETFSAEVRRPPGPRGDRGDPTP